VACFFRLGGCCGLNGCSRSTRIGSSGGTACACSTCLHSIVLLVSAEVTRCAKGSMQCDACLHSIQLVMPKYWLHKPEQQQHQGKGCISDDLPSAQQHCSTVVNVCCDRVRAMCPGHHVETPQAAEQVTQTHCPAEKLVGPAAQCHRALLLCTVTVLARYPCACPAPPVLLQVYPKTLHGHHCPISYQQQQLSRCCSCYQQTWLR
jgi:hypothetical protein